MPEWMLGGAMILGLIVAFIASIKGGKGKPMPPSFSPLNSASSTMIREYDDQSKTDSIADTLDLEIDRTDRNISDLADSNVDLRARLDKLQ